MDAKLMVDSAAAIGTISRKGNGKMRHVRVGNLWIQQQVEDGQISIDKVKGEQNPADLMTKNLGRQKIDAFSQELRQDFVEGRAG